MDALVFSLFSPYRVKVAMAYKGKFLPKNPEKYFGDINNIVYRSLWELRFLKFLDEDPSVLKYSSEELVIPYVSPVDNKPHRYYVDFLIKTKKPDGSIEITAVEIKPDKETRPPKLEGTMKTKTGKPTRRFLTEVRKYAINSAKWDAARKHCSQRGWRFRIATEYDLGIKTPPKKKGS